MSIALDRVRLYGGVWTGLRQHCMKTLHQRIGIRCLQCRRPSSGEHMSRRPGSPMARDALRLRLACAPSTHFVQALLLLLHLSVAATFKVAAQYNKMVHQQWRPYREQRHLGLSSSNAAPWGTRRAQELVP